MSLADLLDDVQDWEIDEGVLLVAVPRPVFEAMREATMLLAEWRAHGASYLGVAVVAGRVSRTDGVLSRLGVLCAASHSSEAPE